MTSKRILNQAHYIKQINLKEFLPIYKNFAPKVYGNTFYENMKYFHDLNLETKLSIRSQDDFVPEYEYVAYKNYTMGKWPSDNLESKKRVPILFSLIKQHHLFGVYKIPEATSIKQVRNELLLSLYDKILGLDSCCTFLCFINRIDAEHISIELFLFGISDLDDLILADILFSPFLINCRYARLDPHNAMYWFYKFHIFIYHNPAILSGASCLITLNTKPSTNLRKLFKINMADVEIDGVFLSDYWGYIIQLFEWGINDIFSDCVSVRDYYEFPDFMQVGPDPQNTQSGIDYVIQFSSVLTWEDEWWGI